MPDKPLKTPAFPFYGKDAYDDEAFCRLTFAEQGLYLFLAWWQWQEGTIPADLDAILDKLPRRKTAEATRCWPSVLPFFPPAPDNPLRRRDESVEKRRKRVTDGIRGKQIGAAMTNAKRYGRTSLSDTLSVADSSRSTLHMHMQEGSSSSSLLLNQDGDSRAPVPDFSAVERVSHLLDNSALSTKPSLQITTAWLGEFGEPLVVETLADCEPSFAGKGYQYLERILVNRRDNPEQRPGHRRAKSRPVLLTEPVAMDAALARVDDVREMVRKLRPDLSAEPWPHGDICSRTDADAYVRYVEARHSEQGGDLTGIPRLSEWLARKETA